MKLGQLMQNFSRELEIDPPFAPSDGGAYVVPLDTTTSFTIRELNPGIEFHCVLAPCPKKNLEQLYTKLLAGNFFGHATGDAALGLSDDGNALTLSRVLEYNVDYELFKEVLDDFINAVDFWQQEAKEDQAA